MTKVFFSYKFGEDDPFVHRVHYHLSRQPGIEAYCYAESIDTEYFAPILHREISKTDWLVAFVGADWGGGQTTEVTTFADRRRESLDGVTNVLRVDLRTRGNTAPEQALPDPVRLYRTPGRHYPFDEANRKRLAELGSAFTPRDETQSLVRPELLDPMAVACAKGIFGAVVHGNADNHDGWITHDGLPHGYSFDYEKDIIAEYIQGAGTLHTRKLFQMGCPPRWPAVKMLTKNRTNPIDHPTNPIPEASIGAYRPHDAEVVVDTRSCYHDPDDDSRCLARARCTFREAGPRRELIYDPMALKVGVVVSGGIAPGINAVIAGIYERHLQYYEQWCKANNWIPNLAAPHAARVMLYQDGFRGILRGTTAFNQADTLEVIRDRMRENAHRGGSLIGTHRYKPLLDPSEPARRRSLLERLVQRLDNDKVNILYVIGGDGSMRAAHAIHTVAQQMYETRRLSNGPISVVGIPKTMDNDILWVWQSFGFMSAVERARQTISQLQTETSSNPRLCIVQLFGSDSGFVVSHAALASTTCDGALIPEVGFTMRALSQHVQQRLYDRYASEGRAYGTIVLAETAIPSDVETYIDNPDYPDIGLEEGEKEATRRFIGSSLFQASHLRRSPGAGHNDRDWAGLCHCLANPGDHWFLAKLWARLPIDVKGILAQVAQANSDEDLRADSKSVIARAINGALGKTDLVPNVDDEQDSSTAFFDRLPPLARELVRFIRIIASMDTSGEFTDSLQRYLKELVDGLSGLSLPYEAEVILDELRNALQEIVDLQESIAEMEPGPEKTDAEERLTELTAPRIWRPCFGKLTRLRELMIIRLNRACLDASALDENGRPLIMPEPHTTSGGRLQGQTPDELRRASLKVVAGVLEQDLRQGTAKLTGPQVQDFKKYCGSLPFRVFTNEPRHMLRAIEPSVQDVIYCQTLGSLAVDNAMAGYTDFMVSQWLTEFVLVPLELVVLGRKRVPKKGIFWRSVLAKTGQKTE